MRFTTLIFALTLVTSAFAAEARPKKVSECEKARGSIITRTECDGSESPWCVISKKEECYADQVKNGHCTVGHYDETARGVVGITPRVLCDGEKNQ